MRQVTANLSLGVILQYLLLLNLLLFHGASLMPPGCGVVASVMLFLVFNDVTITIIQYMSTGEKDCMQMSC